MCAAAVAETRVAVQPYRPPHVGEQSQPVVGGTPVPDEPSAENTPLDTNCVGVLAKLIDAVTAFVVWSIEAVIVPPWAVVQSIVPVI